jgi:uncharacterized protein (DUF302 family)
MDELGYSVESTKSFEELSSLLENVAPERGFRVLVVHDVQRTLADKGFEIEALKIFEVCNAGFAYKALNCDVNAAMFMPCKIVLRSEGDNCHITLARPSMVARMLPESGLGKLAEQIETQLVGILDEIK